MGKWELIVWIGIAVIFNPLFTYFVFVRRALLSTKGKITLYATTTMIALFWCGVSTGYFIFSIIAGAYFSALLVFKDRVFTNIKKKG